MKRAILLSLAILASSTASTRAELNIRIPTPVQVGALVSAGTLTGAFSLLAGRFAYNMALENPNHNNGRPDKLFYNTLTTGSIIAAITSGIITYQAFKNAYSLLK